jgi:hypothetical protein
MAEQTPLYMDISNVYSGDELGLPWRDIIGEGIVAAGDLAVSAGTGNSVNVAAGACWVTGDTNPALQPTYRCYNDAVVNKGINPDPSNPRYVQVIAQITDQGFAGSGRNWQIVTTHGTPAASPTVPATPASAFPLANILVPANAASSAGYTITDLRTRATIGGGQAQSGGAGGITSIFDSTLAAAAANFDITAIPATYRHLRLELYLRSDQAANLSTLQLRFNNDSGNNYSSESTVANAATVAGVEAIAGASARIGRCPGATAPASSFAAVALDIPHYAGATGHKAGTAQASSRETTASGGMILETDAIVWFATPAAINRITVFPQAPANNFVIGSRATLYGIN